MLNHVSTLIFDFKLIKIIIIISKFVFSQKYIKIIFTFFKSCQNFRVLQVLQGIIHLYFPNGRHDIEDSSMDMNKMTCFYSGPVFIAAINIIWFKIVDTHMSLSRGEEG
jgi:hypothetical protein